MIFNLDSTKIIGLSYPDAKLFVFDIASKTTKNLGDIMTHKVFGGPERNWRSVARDLYCDPETGAVYTSGDNGFLVKYMPGADKLELTWMRLTCVLEAAKIKPSSTTSNAIGTKPGRLIFSPELVLPAESYLIMIPLLPLTPSR